MSGLTLRQKIKGWIWRHTSHKITQGFISNLGFTQSSGDSIDVWAEMARRDPQQIAEKIVDGFLSCFTKSHEMETRSYICDKHLEELLDGAFGFPTNLRAVGQAKVIRMLHSEESE